MRYYRGRIVALNSRVLGMGHDKNKCQCGSNLERDGLPMLGLCRRKESLSVCRFSFPGASCDASKRRQAIPLQNAR